MSGRACVVTTLFLACYVLRIRVRTEVILLTYINFSHLLPPAQRSVRISYESSRDPGMRGAGNGMASRPVSRRSRSRYPGRDRTLKIP
eukprot:scaffold5895_cov133-Chaetoceros_neogracile.AAC.1